MSTLLKLSLSGYDEKPRFWAFKCKYFLQLPLFLCGKKIGGTRHICKKKMNPPSIVFLVGGGCTVNPADS